MLSQSFISPLVLRSHLPHLPAHNASSSCFPNKTTMVAPAVPPPSHRRSSLSDQQDHSSSTVTSTSTPRHSEADATSSVVDIYDTTLRDGAQGEGISLSVSDKLKIAMRLDGLGVHYIEGGWPGSNPKDEEFFNYFNAEGDGREKLKHARLVAFGSTRHKSTTCATDANVQALANAGTPVVTLVGKAWHMQVTVVLGTTLEENLAMIRDTVSYFKGLGREVMFDAEHFFDGYEASPEYAMASLRAAAEAGADVLVLCDTNGASLPWRLAEITREVVEKFVDVRVGVHCHNDMEMAVANSLAAVHSGASLIQGTVNGYGERTGNANLMSIIPTLQLKMNRDVLSTERLASITAVSRYVDEIANQPHVPSRPFVGASSFAHKGGLHVAAVVKHPDTYQHIDPTMVGNESRVLVSELAGRRNILSKARELGLLPSDENESNNNSTTTSTNHSSTNEWAKRSKRVLDQVKELENEGYSFEGAEASLELMLRRAMDGYHAPFELLDFSVTTDNKRVHFDDHDQTLSSMKTSTKSVTLATVKIALLGPPGMDDTCPTKICLEAGEGNGPVDAVNAALEKALFPIYPPLRSVSLVDYKVRILDNASKTKATTRVMVDFADSATQKEWTTVFAHPNIIVASVNALMDGFEVAMWGSMPQCIR